MNLPLFVYGSMRDADVRALVLGSDRPEVRAEPAWMPGATAARVPGESYPHLVPSEGGRAPGEVLYGLGETCLDRIRFFEGDEYALVECVVERASGERIAAVHFGGVAIPPAPVAAWSLEQWQASEKARFLSMARKYMAGWRRGTRAEAEALWQRMLGEGPANDGER